MKTSFLKSILMLIMAVIAMPMMAQDFNYVKVNLKDGESQKFFLKDISAIYTSMSDANGVQSSDYQFQYLTTTDNECVYDLANIESLEFVKSSSPAEAIDLGLPSGTKWASCNVGATKPEEYGGYYAWGETEEKYIYNWSSYVHCDGSSSSCHDLGGDISGTKYDVAHVKWGGNWCIPTNDDFDELRIYCNWTWEKYMGVNGARIIGPNGQSIFLPAASFKDNINSQSVETYYGSYWGGIWSKDNKNYPSELVFGIVDTAHSWGQCDFFYTLGTRAFQYCGRSVRPVAK